METQKFIPSVFIPTAEKVTINDYPWGFRLKCTMFDYMEFDRKKGYRHCKQSIDPRTGRDCKAKKSTYHALAVRFYDDKGHIDWCAFNFSGDSGINAACRFVAKHFEVFTSDEINYIYHLTLAAAISDMRATVNYGGSKIDDLKPLYEPFIALVKEGINTDANVFDRLILDSKAIDATKPADYNPFTTTTSIPLSSLIESNG